MNSLFVKVVRIALAEAVDNFATDGMQHNSCPFSSKTAIQLSGSLIGNNRIADNPT